MRREFWSGRRVLVTGHTGFKGSWLSLWLQSMGAEVVGYSTRPPTTPSLFEDADVARGMTSVIGDVRDVEHLKRVVGEHRPEVVLHLAAQPIVRQSYKDPLETFSTNVMGTANVLEAVRHSESVKVCVCITSDKCYLNKEWHWGYREHEELGGHEPYGGSKAAAEIVASTYRHAYFSAPDSRTVMATARAGNVIGGGDWAADRLIPDIVRSFIKGAPVMIRNPISTRPWQHVLVPLSGYLVLAEKLWEGGQKYAEGWNFGPEDSDAEPVEKIVAQMARLWGEGARWELDKGAHPREDRYLKLDCSKAKNLLGWTPQLRLGTTLEWVAEWYKAWQRKEDVRGVTMEQIRRFEGVGGTERVVGNGRAAEKAVLV